MKKILALIAAIGAFGLVNSANMAKATPPGPAYSWTGFYVGVNGGYGWAGNKQFVDTDPGSAPFSGLSPSGGFGGGQIGYNWQGFMNPNVVVGIEADIQGAAIGDNGNSAFYDYKSNLDYFGTVRGRVGYAYGPTLLYFTGGFAYGGLQKVTNTYGSFFLDSKLNASVTGYVLGGGLEYKLTPKWSLKAEYQYLNFGKNDVCASPAFQCFGASNPTKDDAYHTFRLGLNYLFVPAYAR